MIKDKIIRLLGGYTAKEYNELVKKETMNHEMEAVYAYIRSYSKDEDTMAYDKTQLARKIGERMLEANLIDFVTRTDADSVGTTIYDTRAKVYVEKLH